jgi:exo-beta-1,3-glucanase (GH17 family)
VPSGPAALPNFWKDLATTGGPTFVEAVDFVGHNFYVDVFEEPLPLEKVPSEAERILRDLRENLLPVAGIPATVPIHVTENGWPTGKNPFIEMERTYEQQASVLEAVVRTVYRLREELNITHYEFFELRDADSHNDDIFHQFGLLRDDYTPKPAFYVYQNLIRELGA